METAKPPKDHPFHCVWAFGNVVHVHVDPGSGVTLLIPIWGVVEQLAPCEAPTIDSHPRELLKARGQPFHDESWDVEPFVEAISDVEPARHRQ